MTKFSSVFVVLIMTLPCYADTNKPATPKPLATVNRECHFVPPFPPLWPLDQREYEKSLSIPEKEWIHKVKDQIEKSLQIKNDKQNFSRLSCFLEVNKKGEIQPAILFSVELPKSTESAVTKQLLTLSPFPSSNSGYKIFVDFDEGAVTAIRFCK